MASSADTLRVLLGWKEKGSELFVEHTTADGRGQGFPLARVTKVSETELVLSASGSELTFDLSGAVIGKAENVPQHLRNLLTSAVQLTFRDRGRVVIAEYSEELRGQ